MADGINRDARTAHAALRRGKFARIGSRARSHRSGTFAAAPRRKHQYQGCLFFGERQLAARDLDCICNVSATYGCRNSVGSLRATIRRSRKLTAGRRGRILAIYLLIFLLTYAVAVLFQVPYFILVGGRAFSTHPGHQGTLRVMVSAIGTFLSTSFVGPLLEIAFTLIYYDERVRKEGFDLQLMMLTLEGGTATAVTVSAS